MIRWQNTVNEKLTGTVANRKAFDKLNKFVGGKLRILSEVSPETMAVVDDAIAPAKPRKKGKKPDDDNTN